MLGIGWIGMGKMGLPICKRLKGAGFEVKVLCRSAASEANATANGFAVARSIPETADGAEVVFSAIPDDQALREIALALAPCLTSAQVFIETSTVSPGASAEVAQALAQTGCAYLRAPLSGSTATAAQGALTALVSGPAEAFQAVTTVLAAFTRKAFLVGAAEEARTLKLSLNAMLGATAALLAESLTLARNGGLDTQTIMDVVAESAIASPLIQYKRAAVVSGDFTAAFSVKQMLKDFDLIAEAAAATGSDMPLNATIRRQFQAAAARGLSDKDFFVLTAEDPRAKSSK